MSAKIEELKQILLQLLKKEKSSDTVSEPTTYENSIIYTDSIIYKDSIRYTEFNKNINMTNPSINQNINQNINPNNIIDNTYNTDRNI